MKQYDVVIIGSGLGGLISAYILGKAGYKVLILEKNRQLGGSLQTFTRDKCIFDTGIHYIGGLSPGQNLHSIFNYIELMDKLKLKRMDMEGFDRIGFEDDEKVYKYAQGYEKFEENLVKDFPKEREGIQAYISKTLEICRHFPLYNLRTTNSAPDFKYLDLNARDFIASCTNNTRLREVLAGTNPLYAGTGDSTPMYVHAMINNTYIESSWKCIDGGSQITRHLVKSIRGFGGEILRYKEANKFIFEGSDLKHVEMVDGERFSGKYFISNLHPVKTLKMLGPGKVRKAYSNRIENLPNTVSAFCVHIVFKKNSHLYNNYNYYHFKGDVWETANYTKKSWPEGYALYYGVMSNMGEYADTLNILSYMRYEDVKPWENTFNTVADENDRGQSYEDFKTQKAEQLIDEVEKKFPGLRGSIHSYYTSTPLSLRDYIGSEDGSLYGIGKDHKDPLKFFISPRTKVPNLLLTGQNINLHGVLGVAMSALQTCGELIGLNQLVTEINNKR